MNARILKETPGRAPEIAAIVITPVGYAEVRQLMRHLCAQTAGDRMEVVFVVPDADLLELPEETLQPFPRVVAVSLGEPLRSTARGRAAGIRAASAPLVAMTEEHSHPEPDWAEQFLKAFQENSWAAVGPGVINANGESLVSWANFVMEYGQWSDPVRGGEWEHLPGHNSVYRRELLCAYGDRLDEMMEAESILHWDLRVRGHRLCMYPAARTRHWNYSVPVKWIPLRFLSGQLFAGYRAGQQSWTTGKRLLYFLGSPLIPLVRLRRILSESMQPGRPQKALLPRLVPLLLFALVIDALGEAVGYLVGPGRSQDLMGPTELYRREYLNASDRAKENAP